MFKAVMVLLGLVGVLGSELAMAEHGEAGVLRARAESSPAATGHPYYDLGDVNRLRCRSESGRTVVTVEKFQGYQWITVIQDRYRVLMRDVPTSMLTQESFPATYRYQGRTSKKDYLVLGQSSKDFDFKEFSPVHGRVHYVKDGYKYETEVTCQVLSIEKH
jgi:hypothetical protein